MTTLRKRTDGTLLTDSQFRSEHPHTSFPVVINYDEWGLDVVFPAPAPAFDPITQSVRNIDPVLTNKGHWEQQWEIVQLDAATIAANQARKIEQDNAAIKAQITAIESWQARAVREATLIGDKTYLQQIDNQITALRSQLK